MGFALNLSQKQLDIFVALKASYTNQGGHYEYCWNKNKAFQTDFFYE